MFDISECDVFHSLKFKLIFSNLSRGTSSCPDVTHGFVG